MTENMKEKVLEILAEIRPEFDFSEDVNYIENGMLDSLDVINLVVELDNHFGISIDGVDISPENFATLSSILSLLIKNGVKK
jgi:D-alanine--poly(phosphoribitol) ligase subunit 2